MEKTTHGLLTTHKFKPKNHGKTMEKNHGFLSFSHRLGPLADSARSGRTSGLCPSQEGRRRRQGAL